MKNSRGITLIALVITIIVMMILIAVTVGIAVNGGLFNYAGKAAKRIEQEKAREEIQSILPMYYLEQSKMPLQDFLTAYLGEGNVTGFSQKIESTFSEGEQANPTTEVTGYTFCYKGYGFFVEKDSLKLSLLDDMDDMTSTNTFGLYQLITNINDMESGAKYIIVSRNAENNTDAYFVMDEYDEGMGEEGEYVRRKNQLYTANGETILYSGKYVITIEKEGNYYYLYDLYNKEYLCAPTSNEDPTTPREIGLGLGDKDEISRTTINIENGTAQIKFTGNNTYIRNNNFITSCYKSGQYDICLYKYIGTEIKDKLETPTDIIATPDDRKVTLQWNEVEGAYSYTVLQKDEDGNQTPKVVTDNTVVFDKLRNGYLYSYQIRANSNGGAKANSVWTEEIQEIPGSGAYELVTSASDLIAGTRYIIATDSISGKVYTVGEQGTKAKGNVEVTTLMNNIIYHSANYFPLRLEQNSGKWNFKDLKTDRKTYLYGGSKGYWGNISPQNRTADCTISIDSVTYKATIMYKDYKLYYNKSAKIFAGYVVNDNNESSMGALYLYKEKGKTELAKPVVSATGINGQATLTWNMVQGVSYYLVWNGVELNTQITSPHTISNLTNGTEYTYKVKAVKDEEENYSEEKKVTPIATKTYELVTSISSLDSGKAFLVVNGKAVGEQFAMAKSSQNFVDQQKVEVLNTSPVSIEYSGENVYTFIFEYSNVNNAWKIRKIDPQLTIELQTESDLYLYTPFDTNTIRTGDIERIESDNENEYENIDLFNITFDQIDGHVNISGFDSNLSYRSIRYNSQATRFSFYDTSTQGQVYLFKCID